MKNVKYKLGSSEKTSVKFIKSSLDKPKSMSEKIGNILGYSIALVLFGFLIGLGIVLAGKVL